MKLNLFIVNAKTAGTLADYITSQVGAHVKSWASGMRQCNFTLGWKKGRLILQTDSAELIELLQQYELPYIEYLLTEEAPVYASIESYLDAA
jgi:hypothetical protein